MKILAIGDIHGRTIWKEIVEKVEFDKVVFVGDYFDSKDHITGREQINNFLNIVALKSALEKQGKECVLLCGNHDLHYVINQRYSGFQAAMSIDIEYVMRSAIREGYVQACHVHEDILFTHAGLTNTWLKAIGYSSESKLEPSLNELLIYRPDEFGFQHGPDCSPYGDNIYQGPMWVRPRSLMGDAMPGFRQVVGHTEQQQISIVDDQFAFIDTLGTSGECLLIEDGVFSAIKPLEIK